MSDVSYPDNQLQFGVIYVMLSMSRISDVLSALADRFTRSGFMAVNLKGAENYLYIYILSVGSR
jgi:hypothetical protein